MSAGLLDKKEKVVIRLAPTKEIAKADDLVFEPQHQEEARMMIFEGDYLRDNLEEFTKQLMMGQPKYVVVTEVGRQTTFRYDQASGATILLTRAHHGLDHLLKESE